MSSPGETGRIPRLVSVIIPARNAADTVRDQIDAVRAQVATVPFEVVVVDNASTDDTAAVAASRAGGTPELRVVSAPLRASRNYARNAGVAAARGDLLAFCDADDRVDPGWLAALVDAAGTGDLVGGSVVEWNPASAVSPSGWGPARNPGEVLPRPMGFRPIAPGGNCAIWVDVLQAVGAWDERYPRCTDTELSWRVQRAGYRLVEAADAVIRYRPRVTTRGRFEQRFGWEVQHAHLYREFRSWGAPREAGRVVVRQWVGLAVRLPNLVRSRTHRSSWLRRFAVRSGRLWGSIRYGVLYL